MGIQALIRILLPREEHWYDMLEEIAGLSHEAAKALLLFKERPASEVQATVQALEHKADDVVRRMGNALARTFVTPIDREDLHRLTGELDDAIDLMNLSARVFALFRLERPTPPMVELMVRLEQATAVLRALEKLPADRFATATDFATALGNATGATMSAARTRAVAAAPRSSRTTMLLAGVSVLSLAAAAFAWFRPVAVEAPNWQTIVVSDSLEFDQPGSMLAISPTGENILFRKSIQNSPIWLKRADRLEAAADQHLCVHDGSFPLFAFLLALPADRLGAAGQVVGG